MSRRPLHPLLRAAVLVPLAGTLAVHAAAWWGLVSIRLEGPRRPLTDSPAETIVTFSLPSPAPEPAPPDPEPSPEPDPVPLPEPEEQPPEPTLPPPQPAEVEVEPAPAIIEPPAAPPARPPPRPTPPVSPPAPRAARPAPPEPGPASFAGVHGPRASRIVYLVDGSGPMASSLPLVLAEVDRSVSRLTPAQSFQVILFRDPPPPAEGRSPAPALELFGGVRGLLPANEDQQQRLRSWLAGVQPSGRSDPREALSTALSLKPDLIFLLTRSIRRSGPDAAWAGGNRTVLETLDRLNPADPRTGHRPVVIKTIQFIDEDPSGLLKAIAALHGDGPGSYRVMAIEELPAE